MIAVSNFAVLALLVSLPGSHGFLESDWAYHHCQWLGKIPLLDATCGYLFLFKADLTSIVDSMYRIRKLAVRLLEEKMRDSNVILNDANTKTDMMSILVRAKKTEIDGGKRGYAMNNRAMVDQVLSFLGAGRETTTSGLTWTLWHLSNNPRSQRRLRVELVPVFAENPRPDHGTLKNLQWLDCVVMESLRIMPPIPNTARTAAKTGYIDGVLVPKGTLLHICIRAVNTWKEFGGEDAEQFNPERWLNLPKDYHPTFSMLSYLAGPHGCIGETMAIMEMKAVLAALIVNFEFEPSVPDQITKTAAAIAIDEHSFFVK